MKRIAIFASGSGSNAENIINHFKDNSQVEVSLILSNNGEAFVLERARKLNVESLVFDRNDFYNSDRIVDLLTQKNIDLVVLAGFLWLIPPSLIEKFPDAIINIHPALLPKYGGKGMYGMKVHEAVISSGDCQSGITIHYVNEKYDQGSIIFQAKCDIVAEDTPDSLAEKVHELEYKHFPKIIEQLL